MKNKLNIFSNHKINNFLIKLLSKYELNFLTLEEIDYKKHATTANIIIIINRKSTPPTLIS